jgi:hypothetical protein
VNANFYHDMYPLDAEARRRAIFRLEEIRRASAMKPWAGWLYLNRRMIAFCLRLPIFALLCIAMPMLFPLWIAIAAFCGLHRMNVAHKLGVMPHDP